eukprot:Gb_32241 [translate_table: standard]
MVTTLLNLSIYDTNKILNARGAVEPMVEVLRKDSMEAKENAVITLFNLSIVNEKKVRIGASRDIALVDILWDNFEREEDVTSALFNLCIYHGNKAKTMRVGVVYVLIKMIVNQSEGMGDEALAIMEIFLSHHDGAKAIGDPRALLLIIDFMKNSSCNKKNNVIIFLAIYISEP